MAFIARMFGWDTSPSDTSTVVRSTPAGPVRDSGEMINETQKRIRAMEMQKNQLAYKADKLQAQAKKEYQAGNKQRAVQLKKQKIQLDTQIKQFDGQIFNLNQQVLTLQSASGNVEMAKLMRDGTGTMKQLVTEMEGLNVEDVADDLRDAMEESHEIGRALSEPMVMGGAYGMDDDELLEEMAGWSDDGNVKEPAIPAGTPELVMPDVVTREDVLREQARAAQAKQQEKLNT